MGCDGKRLLKLPPGGITTILSTDCHHHFSETTVAWTVNQSGDITHFETGYKSDVNQCSVYSLFLILSPLLIFKGMHGGKKLATIFFLNTQNVGKYISATGTLV